jgi:hypothetical protein
MATAANNEAYGNPAWGGGPQGSPWGNQGQAAGQWQGQGWEGQGQGGQGQGGQGQGGHYQGGWAPPPFWYPVGISKPMAIVFTVLGFIFWWPVGLAILIYMLCSGRIGGRGRARAWQMSGAQGGWQDRGGSWGSWNWKNWCGGGSATGPSSGNRAFDEYKAETLRRLEEEQKEFGAFLDRLRFAKDKAEFDQFMAERRQRPSQPPASQEDPSPAA